MSWGEWTEVLANAIGGIIFGAKLPPVQPKIFGNDPLPFLGQLQMIQKLTRQASKAYRIPFETILTYYETFGRWVPPVKCYVRIRFFNWGSKFGL